MTKRAKFARLALALSVLIVLWFVIAMFGAKAGLWKPLTAFSDMTMKPMLYLIGTAAVVAIAALIATLVKAPRSGWGHALAALAIPGAISLGLGALQSQAGSVPFIHDVATDTAAPPQFSDAMVQARKDDEAKNELLPYDVPLDQLAPWEGREDVAGKTMAELIATGYPDLDLSTLGSKAEPKLALRAVRQAMETRGFENVTVDEDAGRVEGTDVVFWYSFRDDVVARVRAGEGGGSLIDFRSVSRVGLSDLGVNAQRIADLRAGVKDLLESGRAFEEAAVEAADQAEGEETEASEEPTDEADTSSDG